MTTQEMDTNLKYRLRDEQGATFTDPIRLRAMINAQNTLANMLHQNYLTELEHWKTALTLSTSATSPHSEANLNVANLDKVLIRGKEGIVSVRKNGLSGVFIHPIKNDKQAENPYFAGLTQQPYYDIKSDRILVWPKTILSVDLIFLFQPDDVVVATGSPTINEAFHVLMLDLAEAECWGEDSKFDQQKSVYLRAMDEINELNEPFKDKEWRKTRWRYLQPQYQPGFQQ